MATIALNRQAKFEYFLHDKYEAGIALQGCEVKSLREGRVNLKDSFVRMVQGEAYLFNCHITPYSKIQGHVDIDPTRSRKLLLKRKEIDALMGATRRKGFTIVPTALYFKKGLVKVEIAVAEGKKMYDKREAIKKRMHERETQKAVKSYTRRGR